MIHGLSEEFGLGRGAAAPWAVGMYFDAFPDLHHEVLHNRAEEDIVVTRNRLTVTHDGEVLGLPASGRRLACEDGDFFRSDGDGRIAEDRTYDVLEVMQQIGALPADPSR